MCVVCCGGGGVGGWVGGGGGGGATRGVTVSTSAFLAFLSKLTAEMSLRTMWHVTRHVERDNRSMCCT